MGYQDSAPPTEGLQRYSGTYVLTPGSGRKLYDASHKKSPVTLFRVYPEIDVTGAEQPMRVNKGDLSWWLRAEKAVKFFGTTKVMCLTRVKGASWQVESPIDHFSKKMWGFLSTKSKSKAPPGFLPNEWLGWLDEGSGNRRNSILPSVDMCGLLQGMLFEHEGKQMIDPATKTWAPIMDVVLMIPRTGREKLAEMALKPETPDFVSSKDGQMLQITYREGTNEVFPGYLASLATPTIPIPLPSSAWVKDRYMQWDKLLQLHTVEEQMGIIANNFPAESLDLVFGATPWRDALPQGIAGKWDAWQGQKAVSMPQSSPIVAPAPQLPSPPPGYAYALVNGQVTLVQISASATPVPSLPAAVPSSPVYTQPAVSSVDNPSGHLPWDGPSQFPTAPTAPTAPTVPAPAPAAGGPNWGAPPVTAMPSWGGGNAPVVSPVVQPTVFVPPNEQPGSGVIVPASDPTGAEARKAAALAILNEQRAKAGL